MGKKSLLITWLYAKGAILGLLFILLGFNYIFTIKKFWYDSKYNLEDVRRVIKGVGNIDEFDDSGFTALMIASAAGDKDIVEFLIRSGANVNLGANDLIGDTALHSACQNGNIQVVGLLLANYANPLMKNKNKENPLNRIINCESSSAFKQIVKKFMDEGVDINYPDPEGRSLLFAAVDQTKLPMLEILQNNFSYLINFDLKNKAGQTVKQFEVGKGDVGAQIKPVKLARLYAGIDVNAYEPKFSFNKDFNLVQVATIKGKDKYLKDAIKNHGANIKLKDKKLGNTPLHWACLYNWPKVVDVILKNKPVINEKNKTGMTPIHCLWGIRKTGDRKKVAKSLFEQGANFNAQDNKGNSFLHRAVLLKDYDLVKLIATDRYFNHRVNFHLKNKKKQTAMDIAKKFKDKKIIDMLKNNYDIYYLDKKDKKDKITPLMIAAMRGDMYAGKILMKRPTIAKKINAKSKKKDTALHFAIRFGHVDFAKLLLGDKNLKVEVDVKNTKEDTPLHEVVNIVNKKERGEALKLLFSKGADITENKKGETIIHLAVRKNMPELIKFMRENFGKMVKNKKGKTALDLAKELGKKQDMADMIKLLEGKK
ncbi:ankyrin repeat domain-containing protein [Candidatus Dependentiae bacterium]